MTGFLCGGSWTAGVQTKKNKQTNIYLTDFFKIHFNVFLTAVKYCARLQL